MSACKHEQLVLGSTCDVCGKGKMRRASATKYKWLKDREKIQTDSMDYTMFIVCENDACEHYHKVDKWIVGRGDSVSAVLHRSIPDDNK
jgi:hypothetical protein